MGFETYSTTCHSADAAAGLRCDRAAASVAIGFAVCSGPGAGLSDAL